MTLFGALSSGVSGLTAQSSAIGAISDNITNVSTVGYKNTQVDFQTLVTKQTSATFFSAGGVQSKPRQDTGVQGLLASSSSSTDIAISGAGFFVINEAAQPTINNEFLFTRAGSFFQDNEGFLRNTAGFYLQAWPTDAAGKVIPANKSLSVPNQNVISTDFLTTVNLNRVGGTAAPTSTIAIGANLPSNDAAGTTRKTDVQFFDTLGNASTMSFINTKANIDNNWDLTIPPPSGTAVATLEDSTSLTYASIGQLEFKSRPADGATVIVDGITYEFDNTNTTFISAQTQTIAAASTAQVSTAAFVNTTYEVGDAFSITIEGNIYNFVFTTNPANATAAATAWFGSAAKTALEAAENVTVTDGGAGTLTFTSNTPGDIFTISAAQTADTGSDGEGAPTIATPTPNASTKTIVAGGGAEFSQFKTGDQFTISGTTFNNKTYTIDSISADGRTITTTAGSPDLIQESLGVSLVTFTYAGFTETTTRRRVDVSASTTISADVSALLTTLRGFDTDFDTTNNRVKLDPASSTTLLFTEDGTGNIVIDPSGLLTSTGSPAANQDTSFTVRKVNTKYSDFNQLRFTGVPDNGQTMTINGITYIFETAEAAASGFDADTTIRIDTVANMVRDLEESIEANDAKFPSGGTELRRREANNSGVIDTLILPSLASGSYTISFSNPFANIPVEPDGTTTTYSVTADTTVNTEFAIVFNSAGIPSKFNVTKLEILGFSNGAANMDDGSTSAKKISLDFGTVTEANGFTQFGGSFSPVFITQNGSQFGTFAGVTFSADGLVTALFDNGETRPVFQIPLASFVNVNGLGGRTGNVWNATEGSGDPTLRVADNGPAGEIIQSTLEQSTVDIGTEFTKMIVVQRAFSAAAKIITTADEMLEELLRVKR